MPSPENDGNKTPSVMVPLDEYTRTIAEMAAETIATRILERHRSTCQVGELQEQVESDIAPRLRAVEMTQARLIGFLLGSGLLGGGAGALVAKLL